MSASPDTSNEPASSSPVNVMLRRLAMSLLLSTTSVLLAVTVPAVTPSKYSSSVEDKVLPPMTTLPPTVKLPDISTAPFMSTVVAAICISVSA